MNFQISKNSSHFCHKIFHSELIFFCKHLPKLRVALAAFDSFLLCCVVFSVVQRKIDSFPRRLGRAVSKHFSTFAKLPPPIPHPQPTQ